MPSSTLARFVRQQAWPDLCFCGPTFKGNLGYSRHANTVPWPGAILPLLVSIGRWLRNRTSILKKDTELLLRVFLVVQPGLVAEMPSGVERSQQNCRGR